MGKKLRIKDIAERLGVSSTLVSLVLNNKGEKYGIRKETREKVLYVAREMGYFKEKELFPAQQKPGVAVFLVSKLDHTFVQQITPALHACFENMGMGFSVMQTDRDELRFHRQLTASMRFYSAFVLQASAADDWVITALRKQGIPFVVLEGLSKQGDTPQVGIRYDKGMALVINHLYQSGYRNLGLLIPSKEKHDHSLLLAGYFRDQVKKRNELRNAGVMEADLLPEPPADLKERLLSLLRPPISMQAIILTEAAQVGPFYRILRELNIRLPYDLALLCCADDASLELLMPPVTALCKPIREMASEITRILWEGIRDKGKNTAREKVFLEPVLQLRKSCGTI